VSDGARYHVVDADGADLDRTELIPALPADMVPGEIVQVVNAQGSSDSYVVADKGRFWDGNRWIVGYSLAYFDRAKMTERQIYDYRQKMLKRSGMIDR
jgi:hypothetical protein